MKIIVPMAGRGSRLRPHTLTVPKPLIPVAGEPIVHRLVRDIARVLGGEVEEVAYVLGDPAYFGDEVVAALTELSESLGARTAIYRQDQPLGTGHAIMCAEPSLSGPAVIAYADTLIRADFRLKTEADSVIWVRQVERPESYGVVKLNEKSEIVELVEKPKEFVSDLAVIGIYYFREVADLRDELQYVLDNQIIHGGEYQINDGIKRMMQKGKVFVTGEVDDWMDCGNKPITVQTNSQMLGYLQQDGARLISLDTEIVNSEIIEPCYIGPGVVVKDSRIGPFVSIGPHSRIEDSQISHSLIQSRSEIRSATLKDAMIGNHVKFDGAFQSVSLGDYSELI